MEKLTDPDPAAQKSTDPTGSRSSSLVFLCLLLVYASLILIRHAEMMRIRIPYKKSDVISGWSRGGLGQVEETSRSGQVRPHGGRIYT